METLTKESFMSLYSIPNENQSMKPYYLQFIEPNDPQSLRYKSRPTRTPNANIRAGDWVCLLCGNLNFSFRDECNRCQVQTKKENYLKSLLLVAENQKLSNLNLQERVPLQDLTNSTSNLSSSEFAEPPPAGSFPPQRGVRPLQNPEKGVKALPPLEKFECDDKTNFDFSSNYGFENVLLLTPPRSRHKKQALNDHSDIYEEEFPPYRSPKQIPSVTPILKKVILDSQDKEEKSVLKPRLSFSDRLSNISTNFGDSRVDSGTKIQNTQDLFGSTNTTLDDEKCFDLDLNKLLLEEETNNSLSFLSKEAADKYFSVNMNNPWLNVSSDIFGENQRKPKSIKQDWICCNCGNLNYSFRKFCNRCQLSK